MTYGQRAQAHVPFTPSMQTIDSPPKESLPAQEVGCVENSNYWDL
jgi:hypothetical protein